MGFFFHIREINIEEVVVLENRLYGSLLPDFKLL